MGTVADLAAGFGAGSSLPFLQSELNTLPATEVD
jgi:hypothetical protein